MGRGSWQEAGTPQRGHLLAHRAACDSEMQQGTVATAGFEDAQASAAERHLAIENVDLAVLSRAKLLLSFPGWEKIGDGGEMKHQKSLSCSASLGCGLQGCLAHSRSLEITSAPHLCPGLSVTACSPLGWGEQAVLGAGQ